MNITALPTQSIGVAASSARQPRPEAPASEPQESFSWKGAAAGVGGGVAGFFGAGLATAGARQVGSWMSQAALAAMPAVQVSPTVAGYLSTGLALGVVGGAALGALAGTATGVAVAYQAGSGATKSDDGLHLTRAASGSKHQESGAELRAQLSAVKNAEGFGAAAKAGAQAGASFFGPVGASAGKVQGALLGAAVGAVVGLPLSTISPYLMAPTAVAGFLLGAKVGEPVGHVVGSAVGGALGAAGGAAFHGGQKLFGGSSEA